MPGGSLSFLVPPPGWLPFRGVANELVMLALPRVTLQVSSLQRGGGYMRLAMSAVSSGMRGSLRDSGGLLALYRVRPYNLALRVMMRWPANLAN